MKNAIGNGDEPASAIIIDTDENVCFGLTKREAFAMAAMQGNLSVFFDHDVSDYGEIAEDCVKIADKLLDALEK